MNMDHKGYTEEEWQQVKRRWDFLTTIVLEIDDKLEVGDPTVAVAFLALGERCAALANEMVDTVVAKMPAAIAAEITADKAKLEEDPHYGKNGIITEGMRSLRQTLEGEIDGH
jgi:hypothetical protein